VHFVNIESIDIKSLEQAIKKSRDNSLDYLKESELLFDIKSYGHSLSFAILGIEEFGKSIGYRLILQCKLIPLRGRIDFDPNVLFKDIQSRHLTKQSISLIFSLLYQFSTTEAYELKNRIDNQHKTISYSPQTRKFENITELAYDFKTIKLFQKAISSLDNLDKQKQNGLYVEILNDNIINIPKKTRTKVVKDTIDILRKLLIQEAI
jgi:AbiV family abortive infection protein